MTADLQTKLVEVITQLQGVMASNAADAVNFGLGAIRIQGIGYILLGFSFLVISILFFYAVYRIANSKEGGDNGLGFCICSGVISFGISIFIMLYIWNWVAIFQPKLWLAHQILAKAVG